MKLEVAILIAQALLKYGPVLARELVLLFSKETFTLEDWETVFKVSTKSYEDYVKALD